MTEQESARRRAETRLYGAMQRQGRKEAEALEATAWDPGLLEGHKYVLVTTFRRDGEPVPTPVWFVRQGDSLRLLTSTLAGKVKRLRNDPRVLVAPCSMWGKPRGPAMPGRARFLDPPEFGEAEQALKERYSLGRALYYRFLGPKDVLYLEISADADGDGDGDADAGPAAS